MSDSVHISRRAALARLGLGALAAYAAPTVMGLSEARAGSSPTPPSNPTPPSAPTPPSNPTPPSDPTAPSSPSDSDGGRAATNDPSGPSGPGDCRVARTDGAAQISQQDYSRAQRAISRGEARPLREVLDSVMSEHPGRLVQVGFSETGAAPFYRLQIVAGGGAVLSVSVNAASGRIISVRNC